MTKVVAVAGKGGTGKTTFSTLLIRELLRQAKSDILAVDADPNSNLNETLGIEVEETIAHVLDDVKNFSTIPQGMPKDIFVEYRLNQILQETDYVDLLVMGVPQSGGCYCYPNDLMRKHLDTLRQNYDFVVVDNEAGMEHLSRRIIKDIDVLLVVSDCSARGVRSAGRVHEIVKAVGIKVNKIGLIITKITQAGIVQLNDEIMRTGLELIGTIPYDEKVTEFDLAGVPLLQLSDQAEAVQAVAQIVNKLGLIE